MSETAAAGLLADLTSRYAEPQRRYHTIEHVTEVSAEADRLLNEMRLAEDAANSVRMAVWYHDAIYDPMARAGENEEASAALASGALVAAGVRRPVAAEVARLIRLTAGHEVEPNDRPGAVLVDADLSILASSLERYDRYVRDVRAEHVAVDEDTWRSGRAGVLRDFLVRGAPVSRRSGP